MGLLTGKALVLYKHSAPLGQGNLLNLTPMGHCPPKLLNLNNIQKSQTSQESEIGIVKSGMKRFPKTQKAWGFLRG